MIQILMQFKYGIAISGTHGKTTTTAMIFDIFNENQKNPTIINGGLIKSINSSAKLGYSDYFITEADESDQSFLYLKPKIVILTNIEQDHMDHYNNDYILLKKTFLKFLNQIPTYGIAIVCIDNHAVCEILPKIKCKVITYGFKKNADIRIMHYTQNSFQGFFQLIKKNQKKINIVLNLPGKHNALNAAAAFALASEKKISDFNILKSLKNFQGTNRRFECLGEFYQKNNIEHDKKTILIDDYGHHPTEIFFNIQTIKTSWPKKKIIMIFQPHRYTRTYNLYRDFIKVLSKVDILLILHVYSACEPIIIGADSFALYKDIKKIKKKNVFLIEHHDAILKFLTPYLKGNNIIIFQGAGNIEKIAKKFLLNQFKK